MLKKPILAADERRSTAMSLLFSISVHKCSSAAKHFLLTCKSSAPPPPIKRLMTDALLTPAARRFVAAMARAIAPDAGRLDGRFRKMLRARGYNAAEIRALLAITPAAASRLRSPSPILATG